MIIYRVRHLTFFSTSAYFVNGNTLSSCLIWQIISFILPSNEYGCVYAWNFACDRLTEDADFEHFRWCSFWSWRVCKQEKLSHLGHRKLADIHWRANAPKPSHCLVRILVQWRNWTIFLLKWARIIIGPCWTNFCSQKLKRMIGNIWFQDVATCHSRSYTRCFAFWFFKSHYQPESWYRLATSELRFDAVGLLFLGCYQR